MTTTVSKDAPWTGWHRPAAGRPWRRICGADSWDGCWAILTAPVERGDCTVPASGADPNAPPRPAARCNR
jgi:hypothetical protein